MRDEQKQTPQDVCGEAMTPLNKKKAISNHVIKALLVFQYASGSEDSYRRHIREDPGNEVKRFLESEQG